MNNYFNSDNTSGYTQSQLDELNSRLESKLEELEVDQEDKSQIDHVSESILRDFDTELAN